MNKMELYCLKWRKDTENIDTKVWATSNRRAMILSKWAICVVKNSRFFKNQQAKGLVSKVDIKTPLSKVPILGDTLF